MEVIFFIQNKLSLASFVTLLMGYFSCLPVGKVHKHLYLEIHKKITASTVIFCKMKHRSAPIGLLGRKFCRGPFRMIGGIRILLGLQANGCIRPIGYAFFSDCRMIQEITGIDL